MDQEKIDSFNKTKEEETKRKEQLSALNNVATTVSTAVKQSTDAQRSAVKEAMSGVAKSTDIQEVINELKEAQLASYLSGGQKQSVILADSTDLGEAVMGLGVKLDQLAKSLSEDKTDKQLIQTVQTELAKVVTALNKDTDTELVKAIQDLKSSFTGIEVNPVVNVPEPVINVDIPKIDFSKLSTDVKAVTKAVQAIKPAQLDLSALIEATDRVSKTVNGLTFPVANFVQDPYIQYKAVDEFDDGVATNVKYYGFIEPRGNWYILKNDPVASAKTYRYAFGDSDYETAWTNRASLTYGYPFGK